MLVKAKDFATDGTLDMLLHPNNDAARVVLSFGAGELLDIALPGTRSVTDYPLGTHTYVP